MCQLWSVVPWAQPKMDEWVASRPPVIQEMIRKKPLNRLYRIDSGHRCTIHSYSEDETVTVVVDGVFNFVVHARNVFGIPIDQLQECDLPAPSESLGDFCEMHGIDVQHHIDYAGPLIRAGKAPSGEGFIRYLQERGLL